MFYKAILAGCLAAVLGACTALDPEYMKAATRPTPAAWTSPAIWRFDFTSEDGHPRGNAVFAFTDEQVPTCASGRWRRVIYRGGTSSYPELMELQEADSDKYAAYLITGEVLVVQLNAPYCRHDIELRGMLSERGASGTFNWVGTVGAQNIGGFTATRAN
jgi:hypothetical protein